MIDFRGKTIELLDTRTLLNVKSISEEIREFCDMIDARRQDHINWLNKLESCVHDDVEFTLTTDPHKCAFGKWYDHYESKISEKRAIECDNEFNFDFFNVAGLACKEVLRMEVRLNKTRKLKEVLAKVGYEITSPTFSDVFNKELAKQVLIYFWNISIKPSLPTLILAEQTEQDIYYQAKSLGMNDNKALQVVGALNIIKAEGFRPLRNSLSSHSYY